MEHAPNRLREQRMAAGLSQQALADRIGVSKVTISDLERGNMRLDVVYMQRLAGALGIAMADLLPHDGHEWALSPAERALIDRFRQASPQEREQLERVSDALLPFRHQPKAA